MDLSVRAYAINVDLNIASKKKSLPRGICKKREGTMSVSYTHLSLRHLNLIVELESEFGVEFDPEEISGMKCFEDIERVLTQKL